MGAILPSMDSLYKQVITEGQEALKEAAHFIKIIQDYRKKCSSAEIKHLLDLVKAITQQIRQKTETLRTLADERDYWRKLGPHTQKLLSDNKRIQLQELLNEFKVQRATIKSRLEDLS